MKEKNKGILCSPYEWAVGLVKIAIIGHRTQKNSRPFSGGGEGFANSGLYPGEKT
mgnify:CR=1 FL=1